MSAEESMPEVASRSGGWWLATVVLGALLLVGGERARGQLPLNPLQPQTTQPNALTNPAATPGADFLDQLEGRFAADVAKDGGKAFASWFAPDAVTLANGKAPVIGQEAIAAQATWTPQQYQLSWTPEGARMNPDGNTGFTWGSYTGVAKDAEGNATTTQGRYITFWKKQPDGSWKVALDASNDGPPGAGDCCKLP
jgi:ketosteroid isomerase-like protein